jgi:flavin-dependent dehydrogenase
LRRTSGTPRPRDGISTAYAPRRTVLDKILVDAADQAGAEVRERFTVDEIVVEDGVVVGIRGHDEAGQSVFERSRRDRRRRANSQLAKAVPMEQLTKRCWYAPSTRTGAACRPRA